MKKIIVKELMAQSNIEMGYIYLKVFTSVNKQSINQFITPISNFKTENYINTSKNITKTSFAIYISNQSSCLRNFHMRIYFYLFNVYFIYSSILICIICISIIIYRNFIWSKSSIFFCAYHKSLPSIKIICCSFWIQFFI